MQGPVDESLRGCPPSLPSSEQPDAAVVEHQRRVAQRGEASRRTSSRTAGARRSAGEIEHPAPPPRLRARRRSGLGRRWPSAHASGGRIRAAGRGLLGSGFHSSGFPKGLHRGPSQRATTCSSAGVNVSVSRSLIRPSALRSAGSCASPAGCSQTCCVRPSELARAPFDPAAAPPCAARGRTPPTAPGRAPCASLPIVAPSSRASTNSTPLCGHGADPRRRYARRARPARQAG